MMKPMYNKTISSRHSPPTVLLRKSRREEQKIVKHTLANLSQSNQQLVELLRVLLKGGVAVSRDPSVFSVERTLPHGHMVTLPLCSATLARTRYCSGLPGPIARKTGTDGHVDGPFHRSSIQARPHRMLQDETAISSLGRLLDVGQCGVKKWYRLLGE